jgi:formylglycine-generating enzyme required for sulfatase activity
MPYVGFSALGNVYLAGKGEQVAAAPAAPPTQARLSEAVEAWAVARDATNVAALELFIGRFKDTYYADLAGLRIEELKKQKDVKPETSDASWWDRLTGGGSPAPPPKPGPQDQVAILTPPAQPPPQPAHRCDGIEITVGQSERRCFKPGAGKTEQFKDCPTCPEMVVVPAGTFTMGSPADEPQRYNEEAQVRVSISEPFAVGRFAVTFDEWDACFTDGGCNGYKPHDRGWGRGKQPVINVNWDDAKAYTAWLSRKTGKAYRLLSEAEREYATRAGSTTPFWWGSSITTEQANYDGSADPYKGGGSKGEYRQRTVPVDSFEPNPWGLYQVHGNVYDWTEDCWNESNTGNPGNGSARTASDCSKRVLRGGFWGYIPRNLRSAYRFWGSRSGIRYDFLGFRLARTLHP